MRFGEGKSSAIIRFDAFQGNPRVIDALTFAFRPILREFPKKRT
jgi:hypothetical protein